jgi:transposase
MTKHTHPQWATEHRKPGTELKLIGGKYYLYGVTSSYDKNTKTTKKISLGIIGSITEANGLVPSPKQELKIKLKNKKTTFDKELFVFEYGFSKWLFNTLTQDGILADLKLHFPNHWQFIIVMMYSRIAYQSPLKNICFYYEQSDLGDLTGWNEKLSQQKISDSLFTLGAMQQSIHQFMQPKDALKKTVLMDATDITLQSNKISLSQKGYNSNMDFTPQFVLLYLYDAQSLKPLYYRLLPGNIREISALQNTINLSGIKQCLYIADKGFFSEANIKELTKFGLQYIMPLKRDNKCIPYNNLNEIEQTENYFDFAGRYIFYTSSINEEKRSISLFLDGKLKEQEKVDYLSRISTLPENYSKIKFNEKVKAMGTLCLIHNTDLQPEELYREYKNRGEIEQFFDHFKNTIDASTTYMQREESLNGWMFINHLSMQIIYKIFSTLKTTQLNNTQKLNHKYSIKDVIEHLKTIKKIKTSPKDFIIAEINKATKTLLEKMKLSVT